MVLRILAENEKLMTILVHVISSGLFSWYRHSIEIAVGLGSSKGKVLLTPYYAVLVSFWSQCLV